MDRAVLMREAAAAKAVAMANTQANMASAWRAGCSDVADAIRALPLPPQPPLDAEVVGMVRYLRGNGEGSAADLIKRLAREKAEAERRVKWVEAEINSCMDANFRQAMCINNTASALGPEISATIDGLPKAARHVRTRAEKAEAEVARLQDLLNKTAANTGKEPTMADDNDLIVQVKPLVWEDAYMRWDENSFTSQATGVGLVYTIACSLDHPDFENEVAIRKAAAQAHHESRLLSGVDVTPAPTLAEAAKVLRLYFESAGRSERNSFAYSVETEGIDAALRRIAEGGE